MNELTEVAPSFVTMAHEIVWCSTATVDPQGRPRSRVLHPLWEWDGTSLTGWIATSPLSPKRADLDATPMLSCTYWATDHDTCTAECRAEWANDEKTKRLVWDKFLGAPPPVGYDPAMIPAWDVPESEAFGALRLKPWRLRVMPGSVLLAGQGEVLTWQE